MYRLCSAAFMALLFTVIALFVAYSVFGPAPAGAASHRTPLMLVSAVFVILAIVAAALQFRSGRDLIERFSYDGQELRFRTLGGSAERIWRLAEIAEVRESRRGQGIGYLISLRDRRRVILDYAVSNGIAAAVRMQADIALSRSVRE